MSQQLKNGLKRILEDEVSNLGLSMPIASQRLTEKMINIGVQRMVTAGADKRQDRVLLAETNLKAFVQGMAVQARVLKTGKVIGAKAFQMAKNAHSFWPFC